jgi:Family of unknown function (DUF6069)
MSSKTSTPAASRTQRPTQRTRLLAVAGAAAAALAVWAVAVPLAGVDVTVRMAGGSDTQQIGSGEVVLAVSLLGAGVTTAATVALTGMHLAAAAVLIPLLARSARPRRS